MTSVGQDAEKKEPSCTAGGNSDWCSHCGEQYGVSFKKLKMAKTGLAQWIEHWPADRKLPGSIPVKGMYLGCRHIPDRGCATVS